MPPELIAQEKLKKELELAELKEKQAEDQELNLFTRQKQAQLRQYTPVE